MNTSKICPSCNINKVEKEYSASKFKRMDAGGKCRKCIKIIAHDYYEKNIEKVSIYGKQYREKHKEEILEYKKNYAKDHKIEIANYKNDLENKKRKENPSFKLRKTISATVRKMLKLNNESKLGKTILRYLPYSMDELKFHIEKQFESWMNWENWGIYDIKTWNGNDSATWTWQLDHNNPQSDYPYDSMDHSNFLKVWDLSNLRPLRSDINIKEGSTRARHKII